MAEFPTYEEMAKNVAEKALDDFLYNGKSIREWMQIIASEDCISRKDLIEYANNLKDGIGITANDIARFPSIQPKTKTGHWIIKEGREQGYDIAGIKTWYIQIMCDKCGFIKTAIEGHTGQYHFCPNCGAKMESEK